MERIVTSDIVEALKELEREATPGDWIIGGNEITQDNSAHVGRVKTIVASLESAPCQFGLTTKDARFVVFMRNTILTLLAEREEMQRHEKGLAAMLKKLGFPEYEITNAGMGLPSSNYSPPKAEPPEIETFREDQDPRKTSNPPRQPRKHEAALMIMLRENNPREYIGKAIDELERQITELREKPNGSNKENSES